MGHECPQGGGKGSSTVGVPAVKDGDRVMREGRNNAGTSDNTKQTISISPLTKFLFVGCFRCHATLLCFSCAFQSAVIPAQ
jgi:hypothetical protein